MRTLYYPGCYRINVISFNTDVRRLSWWNSVDTNPIAAAPNNTLTATTTTGGAGRARTILGKRARNGYGHSHRAPNRLTTIITAGQARVGPWMRQRDPGRGFTLCRSPGPNKPKNNTSMTLWREAEKLAPQQPRGCIVINCRDQGPRKKWWDPTINYELEGTPNVQTAFTGSQAT